MRGFILASSLALVILVAGYMTITSSSYESISQLSRYRKPTMVTLRASIESTRIIPEKNLILFVLQGKKGNRVYAFYELSRFISQYGAPPSHSIVDQEVVIRGTFYPAKVGNVMGKLEIEEILQGCHKAYEAPPATGG